MGGEHRVRPARGGLLPDVSPARVDAGTGPAASADPFPRAASAVTSRRGRVRDAVDVIPHAGRPDIGGARARLVGYACRRANRAARRQPLVLLSGRTDVATAVPALGTAAGFRVRSHLPFATLRHGPGTPLVVTEVAALEPSGEELIRWAPRPGNPFHGRLLRSDDGFAFWASDA